MGIVVSETDLEGRITYVNEAFVQISGYSEAELLRQPHRITRHPEMPVSLFGQLWKKLREGEDLYMLIRNRSKDGVDYWEMAHITRRTGVTGGLVGYRSVRRPADAEEIARFEPFYRKVRKLEIDAERLSAFMAPTGPALAQAAFAGPAHTDVFAA